MIDVNGVELCTEPFGDPVDPPILLIMGIGGSMLWWEEGFTPRRAEGFVDAMRDALGAYLRFAGATRLEWPPHLAAEKRLLRARP